MNKNMILFTDLKIVYIHYKKITIKKIFENLLIQD